MSLGFREIQGYLETLDGRGSDEEFAAVDALSELGMGFPALLLERYRQATKWGERASCVYHATKYAKNSAHAFQLGVVALGDRSSRVRYRACMLLAVAQNREALGPLQELLSNSQSEADARAAIDAIEKSNVHLFVDREHTGKITLCIGQPNS